MNKKNDKKQSNLASTACNVRLRITINNKILGNSEKIMPFDKIKDYNRCAYICAVRAINFGGKHSMGMWTVEVA